MKLGLALSGGTLRGAAHIGVIDVLHQAGIRPDLIAGTSAGSVIGSLYAHGLPPSTLIKIATSFPGRKLVDWTTNVWGAFKFLSQLPLYWFRLSNDISKFVTSGFIRGNHFEKYLNQLFQLTPVNEPIHLFVTTVDLHSAEVVVFTDTLTRYEVTGTVMLPMHDKAACIRASCSMPGIFVPREIDGRTLVDGAVRNYIPAEILFRAGCDKVIVVDLLKTELQKEQPYRTFLDVFMRCWDIMVSDVVALQLYDENLFAIQPVLNEMQFSSFDKIEYAIEKGRQAARESLPRLQTYIKKPTLR